MGIKETAKRVITGKYNDERFWRYRHAICRPGSIGCLKKLFYAQYCQRMMRRYCADIAVGCDDNIVGPCENFAGPPDITVHGINGIVIAGGARIGKNVTISHQVTIGRSRGLAPVIGDGVYIGPGAKIFGGIRVGNNVRIGANCVVFQDVPDNATIVLGKPRVIEHEAPVEYYTGGSHYECKDRRWPEDLREES